MIAAPDRLAAAPKSFTDPLSEVLSIVHARGDSAQILAPDFPCTVSFPGDRAGVFVVQQGQVTIEMPGERPVELVPGQLALLLHSQPHALRFHGGGQALPIDHFTPEQGVEVEKPIGSGITRCFWGSFTFDGGLAAKVLQGLPRIVVLEDLENHPIEWLEIGSEMILLEMRTQRPGASVMVSRLLDLLLIQILRRWANSAESLPGWLAAAHDERIARAVSAIHRDPSQNWTNDQLARLAGMSRSSFVDRFGQAMGQQPGAYIRGWRLDLAAESLRHSNASIDTVAAQVGYASPEAFSRAFQSRFGRSPSFWRSDQVDL